MYQHAVHLKYLTILVVNCTFNKLKKIEMISHKNLGFQLLLKNQRHGKTDILSIRRLMTWTVTAAFTGLGCKGELATVLNTLCCPWPSSLFFIWLLAFFFFFFFFGKQASTHLFAKNNKTKDESREPHISRKMRALISLWKQISYVFIMQTKHNCVEKTLNQLPSHTPPL